MQNIKKGIYTIDQYDNSPQDYYFFNNAFTREELDKIERLVDNIKPEDASTLGQTGMSDVRRSRVKWITKTEDTEWLYERMVALVQEANQVLWRFDITAVNEDIQYTEYHAEDEGHYTWHQDIGHGIAAQRKISITIQLSESDEYEGGDLQIWQGGEHAFNTERGAGVAVLFPSYMMHRVSKTTKGIRKSLVLWVGGSSYR
jgi:PKHD-type hydroxylase